MRIRRMSNDLNPCNRGYNRCSNSEGTSPSNPDSGGQSYREGNEDSNR